ncbi:MMPL family transporter [methanogenic archaeon mixed culture ISO4-G1]|nr:MMPL family transporter [methanogenic archaeon mixed culture ISO4-G1]
MIFDRVANGIQRHAKAIVVIWVVILCISGYFAIRSPEVMSYDLNEMASDDSESIKGLVIISTEFPAAVVDESVMPILVLYYEDEEGLAAAQQFITDMNERMPEYEHLVSAVPMDPITKESGDGILMAYILTKDLDVFEAPAFTPEIRNFIDEVAEATGFTGAHYLTGSSAMSYDMEHDALEDISKIDPFTVLMILLLVGLFFRSFVSSATPPLTIGVAFAVTMALIFGLGHILNIFFLTNMMILVSMMGAGCDYCIFIIARYREELRTGLSHDEALHQAIVWAGESITISGASVIIGFGAISVCDYAMISTMGICLALGILVALIAALTLIPAMLQLIGDRVFWPTKMDAYKEGGKATKGWYAWCGNVGNRYFHRSADFSVKHAKAIAVVAIMITAPAVYVMTSGEESYDMISSMLGGESGEGMEYIDDYADQGLVMPNYTLIQYKEPIATVEKIDGTSGHLYWTDYWKETVSPTLPSLYTSMEEDENIAYAVGPFVWDDIMEMIEEEGITDTDEKMEFVKAHLSAKGVIFFNQFVKTVSGMGMDPKYLFTGPGQMIDDMVKLLAGVDFDWDAIVDAVKAAGITDPDQIVQVALQQITQQSAELGELVGGLVAALNKSGISNEALVDGFGTTADYLLNVSTSVVGGDFVDNGTGSGDATYISVTTATVAAAMSPTSMESISKIADVVSKYAADNSAIVVETWDTGSAVVMYDVSEEVKKQFTFIEVLVVIMILILLFVVMRSYLIPVRSVLTILMSITWTLAMTRLIFVDLLGGELLWLVPILLLVICLGLGMDYDILLTTRIKENRMHLGMTNDEAIKHAVTHTGSVITICGLIMGGAFGTLMISSMPLLQEFGFALCFAILVDALIVRTYIVPAIMHLLGDWNWKGPGYKEKMRSKE